MGVIDAYITNLGRYVEGHLDGEYLKLPADTEDVKALLRRIGVDGRRYEEIFITDYETEIEGLYDCLGEYESIDELNYFAALLGEMDEWDREKFSAALEYGEYTGSVKDLINLAQNLDCYDYYPGVHDNEGLGYYLIDELSMLEVPEHLTNYFDYEAYGRDISVGEGGVFTDNGFIMSSRDGFTEHYNSRADIPKEYRIFAYPAPKKTPIRETLKMYQQMIDTAPVSERPRSVTHEGR